MQFSFIRMITTRAIIIRGRKENHVILLHLDDHQLCDHHSLSFESSIDSEEGSEGELCDSPSFGGSSTGVPASEGVFRLLTLVFMKL